MNPRYTDQANERPFIYYTHKKPTHQPTKNASRYGNGAGTKEAIKAMTVKTAINYDRFTGGAHRRPLI